MDDVHPTDASLLARLARRDPRALDTFEFIPIKSSVARMGGTPRHCAGYRRCLSPERGRLPEATVVFDAATALDTARDMADLQPTRVELLVSHVRLPREFLPQIGINSTISHPSP